MRGRGSRRPPFPARPLGGAGPGQAEAGAARRRRGLCAPRGSARHGGGGGGGECARPALPGACGGGEWAAEAPGEPAAPPRSPGPGSPAAPLSPEGAPKEAAAWLPGGRSLSPLPDHHPPTRGGDPKRKAPPLPPVKTLGRLSGWRARPMPSARVASFGAQGPPVDPPPPGAGCLALPGGSSAGPPAVDRPGSEAALPSACQVGALGAPKCQEGELAPIF